MMKGKRSEYGFLARCKKYRLMLLFPLPAIVLVLLFSYFPLLGLTAAFKENINYTRYGMFEALAHSSWSLVYFKTLFTDLFTPGSEFNVVFVNTIVISVLKIVFYFPIPILLAVLLTEITHKRFSKATQAIIFLPHFLSWAIVYSILKSVFDQTNGILANILALFGSSLDAQVLGEAKYFRSVVVLSAIWKEAGWGSIIYIAAITAIDPTYYEAAKIDGAGKMRQIVSITLPSIASTIAIMFVLRLGSVMDAGFEQIFLMKSPTNKSVAEIIGTFVYNIGIASSYPNYSYSIAIGLFNSVIAFALVLGGNLFVKKVFKYSIW